jgi:hypothetical protein
MRLWRTGRLPWKTLRVSQPRAPLPTASKALTILIYLTNHNNIQGSGWGLRAWAEAAAEFGPTDRESCGASAYATVRAAAEPPPGIRVARGEEG